MTELEPRDLRKVHRPRGRPAVDAAHVLDAETGDSLR
ncbi:hypothetical protein EDD92_3441 [Streptomyces sp. TLI_185]|nr:hypothetical protein EDD92_3441 [Streptomyces sp. TLI_185]